MSAGPTPKKVWIKTFGCQMNEYDSDKMSDVLAAADGYEPTSDVEEADLILFNTCSIELFLESGPRNSILASKFHY